MSADEKQNAERVLMIRPAAFAANPQTAASNAFQAQDLRPPTAAAQQAALVEFDGLAQALDRAGVEVLVFDDTPRPHTPDSIFPNNWVSFHADGTVVLYPMMAENRRDERRMDVLESLSAQHRLRISRIVDLTHHEQHGKFLEGTGSLVLDRTGRVAYACLSPRTDLDVLGDFAQQLDYDVVAFEATDRSGAAIYHTNVLMSIGTSFAAVCSESIREAERHGVLNALREGGRTILDLTFQQMSSFAGNMLELRDRSGRGLVAMSQRARDSLAPAQLELIQECAGPIVSADIPVIETLGGGSVRCMIAEVFLPARA